MANHPNDHSKSLDGLRARAEAAWQTGRRDLTAIPPEQLPRLVQDLEVRQIELELENEELRAVRASEDRYRGLAEQVFDGIFVADSQGRYVDANRAGCEMLGYTLDELKTLTIPDVVATDERLRLPEQFRRLAAGEIVRNEWRFRRKDGSIFMGELVGRQFADGRLQGIVRDITERRQEEAELARQAALLDLAHNAIFVRDREGRITYWNESAVRCYGWSRDEAMGHISHSLLKTRFPEPLERIIATLKGTGRWEGELVHTCRDGRIITVDSRWAIQHDAKGEGFRILEVNNDITERKRLERERQEEGRRKDEFLAVLGHELRNPLAAIYTAIHVLSGAPPPPSALRAKMEAVISRQTAMMRRLVDDLLELERITRGHIELKLDRQDLAECLQRAVAAMQQTVASRGQELLLRLPSESVHFMADGARLDQIIGNLLANASKYTGPGGRIELSGTKEGADVIVCCKDNGQGIAPEDQQTIFVPFARGRRHDESYGEASLGLGLPLTKQLTELHGGTIAVESGGVGLGSEFTVRLPLQAPPSDQQVELASKHAPSPRRAQSVVIVEDNPTVAETLMIALERAGHSVHSFADGSSALAGMSGLNPDAVLIDIGLPGMDGYEVATKLKHQDSTKHAICIAVSGFKRRREGDDFDQYFSKPVDVGALLDFLDQRT